jgi:hypothetical protein
MAIPTNHFRHYSKDFAPQVLQQLFVFEEGDAYLLSNYSMTDIDTDVFKEEPNHLVSEWVDTISHEWRTIPHVISPVPVFLNIPD